MPLLCLFLWRSRARAAYAGVFLVVAALELYGTAIGTWQWGGTMPGHGHPAGNPPSGVASGYVWFDVMALLLAPVLLRAVRGARRSRTARAVPQLAARAILRSEPTGTISSVVIPAAGSCSS